MFGIIVHHWAKPERFDEGKRRVLAVGRLQQTTAPGLLTRHTFTSSDESHKITTVTIWEKREQWESWMQDPRQLEAIVGINENWRQPAQRETFEVLDELS
jgi:heme-degrading monooxygenase HmoA